MSFGPGEGGGIVNTEGEYFFSYLQELDHYFIKGKVNQLGPYL